MGKENKFSRARASKRAVIGGMPAGLSGLMRERAANASKPPEMVEITQQEAVKRIATGTQEALQRVHLGFIMAQFPEELVIGATSYAAMLHAASCRYAAAKAKGETITQAREGFNALAENVWGSIEKLHAETVAAEMAAKGLSETEVATTPEEVERDLLVTGNAVVPAVPE